ncbi:MAG: lytic transglycosylase domain-containing protein [Burkholderiales bacterium]
MAFLPATSTWRALATCIVLLAACREAQADVWGYVDAEGRPHVATRKIDERYQLFYRGKSTADPAAPAVPPVDAEFEQSAIFRRVDGNPNVARFEPLLARFARQHALDLALVKAVVAVESAYEPDAVSTKGAIGLMQVMPETAERYGVTGDAKRTLAQKLSDPVVNVGIGTRYLRDLLVLFADDLALALAAYNAGEGTVRRFANRVPPFPETQQFLKLVDQFHALYKPPPPAPAAGRITIPIPKKPAKGVGEGGE